MLPLPTCLFLCLRFSFVFAHRIVFERLVVLIRIYGARSAQARRKCVFTICSPGTMAGGRVRRGGPAGLNLPGFGFEPAGFLVFNPKGVWVPTPAIYGGAEFCVLWAIFWGACGVLLKFVWCALGFCCDVLVAVAVCVWCFAFWVGCVN